VGVEAWADLVALRGSAGAADYVLPGGKPWARYRVVMGLARWARAEGYVGRQHVAHDLRAISADEIADDQEWGPYVADRWLRHAPRSVGDRHYRELRLPATFAGVGLWGLRAG